MATYATTLTATYMTPLNDVERLQGWNTKFTIPYTFVAQASATTATDVVTVTLGSTPTAWMVDKARAVITTPFTTTGTGTITIQVGTTSSVAAFISAQSVLTAGALGQASTIDQLTNATATAARSMVATFTNAAEGSLSGVTAGSVTVLLNVQSQGDSTFQPSPPN
jgi:hypothetical protein